MTFIDHIEGNDKIKTYLSQMVEKKRVPSALLFIGQMGSNKSAFAKAFAKLIVESERDSHPDIHHYYPEGKLGMHSIQSIRHLIETVVLAPYSAKKKVYLIHHAHQMLATSANALLKTLEEPTPCTVMILLSSESWQILPTLRSRCQPVRFQSTQTKDAKIKSHPIRKEVLNFLSSMRVVNYSFCKSFATSLSSLIEERMKTVEENARKRLVESFSDKPTAVQTHMIEKEAEGAASFQKTSDVQILLDTVLSWQRDLECLKICQDKDLLINDDYKEHLMQALQRGQTFCFEVVEKACSATKLAVARSTSLSICLENLLLQLFK